MACASTQSSFHNVHPFPSERMTSFESFQQSAHVARTPYDPDFIPESRPPIPVPGLPNEDGRSGPSFLDQLVAQVKDSRRDDAANLRRKGYEQTVLYCQEPGTSAEPGSTPQSAVNPPKPKPRKLSRTQSTQEFQTGSDASTLTVDELRYQNVKQDGSPAVDSPDADGRYETVERLSPSRSKRALSFEGKPTFWFHGAITRKEAEERLQTNSPGSFLIRIGERHLGYSLSVRTEKAFKHYIIKQPAEKAFQLGSHTKVHQTVHDLVDFFQEHPLSANGDGLLHPCSY